jgi:hypothetical protein
MQTILYGAPASTFFPGQVWGGMTADTAVFTQAALDLPSLLQQWDPASHGQWRIFSKLGKTLRLFVTCACVAAVLYGVILSCALLHMRLIVL